MFGTKAALLKVVVDVAIAGDDEPVALLGRPTMQQLRDETDPGRFLGLYAGLVTDISGRLRPWSRLSSRPRRPTPRSPSSGARWAATASSVPVTSPAC